MKEIKLMEGTKKEEEREVRNQESNLCVLFFFHSVFGAHEASTKFELHTVGLI